MILKGTGKTFTERRTAEPGKVGSHDSTPFKKRIIPDRPEAFTAASKSMNQKQKNITAFMYLSSNMQGISFYGNITIFFHRTPQGLFLRYNIIIAECIFKQVSAAGNNLHAIIIDF